MNKVSLSLAFSIYLVVSGCSTFEGYPEEASSVNVSPISAVSQSVDESLNLYEAASSLEDRAFIRNNLLRRHLIAIDASYEEFEKNVYVQNLRGTVYTDWSTNLLNSVSPITDHIPTRNTLSGLSTVLSGGKSIYESNVLAKGIMPALIAEMRASREKVRNKIRERSTKSAGEYDLYDALVDLNEYRVAGSIPSAVASLNASISEDKKAVEKMSDSSIRSFGFGGGYIAAPTESTLANSAVVGAEMNPEPVRGAAPVSPVMREDHPSMNPESFREGAPVSAGEEPIAPVSVRREEPPPGMSVGGINTNNSINMDITDVIEKWVSTSHANRDKLLTWLEKDPKRPKTIEQLLTNKKYIHLRYEVYETFIL